VSRRQKQRSQWLELTKPKQLQGTASQRTTRIPPPSKVPACPTDRSKRSQWLELTKPKQLQGTASQRTTRMILAIAAEARRHNLLLSDYKRDLAAARLMPSGPWNDATRHGEIFWWVCADASGRRGDERGRCIPRSHFASGSDRPGRTLQQGLVGVKNGRFGKGVFSLIDEVGDITSSPKFRWDMRSATSRSVTLRTTTAEI
jgi:hypothetical protein